MFRIEGIDHVALAVRDVERSVNWYTEVLGLTRLHQDVWGSYPAVVGAGATALALFPVEGAHAQPPPKRDTLAMRHVAFRVSRADFERAQTELPRRGIPVEFQDPGIAHSIYFHDPDGHELELTTYEIDPLT
jgi:catechol 2,3-dioxygenase-like lactoylglutathione lyase family enzyme